MTTREIPLRELDAFAAKPSDRPKLVVVYGPTACGKTNLSLDVAERLGSEVVGADSRQIYRDLVIGTGTILPSETRGIPHRLIGFLPLGERYSAGAYKADALSELSRCWEIGKIPILCGGTGLYIDSVVYDFSLPPTPPDSAYRETLERLRVERGNDALWRKLADLDPEAAASLHPNSYPYVMRALELREVYGLSKSDLSRSREPAYETLFLTPYDGDRARLYGTIDARVRGMFDQGLVAETRDLLSRYPRETAGLATIGYRETVEYLDGIRPLDETVSLVAQRNRNYAKQQITWFRKYPAPDRD